MGFYLLQFRSISISRTSGTGHSQHLKSISSRFIEAGRLTCFGLQNSKGKVWILSSIVNRCHCIGKIFHSDIYGKSIDFVKEIKKRFIEEKKVNKRIKKVENRLALPKG
jgi:hypothetical protein